MIVGEVAPGHPWLAQVVLDPLSAKAPVTFTTTHGFLRPKYYTSSPELHQPVVPSLLYRHEKPQPSLWIAAYREGRSQVPALLFSEAFLG